jgi:hypothetical protein
MGAKSFEVEYNGMPVKVEVFSVFDEKIYRAHFQDRPALILSRAKRPDNKYFWTSIPEGRRKFAEEVGALIEEHIKSEQ